MEFNKFRIQNYSTKHLDMCSSWTMYHFIQGQFQNLGFISRFLCARHTQLNKVKSICQFSCRADVCQPALFTSLKINDLWYGQLTK